MSNNILQKFPSSFSHTFFDSLTMYADDLQHLAPKQWLNDSCINFYYLYLENVVHAEEKDKFLFVSPSTIYWVQMAPSSEDIRDAVEPLGIAEKEIIFMPINDNADHEQAGGGNHWSLVMYRRSDDTYYVYDSHSGANLKQAHNTIAKIDPFVRPDRVTREDGTHQGSNHKIVSRASPQQQNSFDCGVFVLDVTNYLSKHSGEDTGLCDKVTQVTVAKLRRDLIDIIHGQWQQDIGQA